MANWLTQLFGSRNQRLLSGYSKSVAAPMRWKTSYKALSDEQLRARPRSSASAWPSGETLDDLLPEAFAAVREAARRTLGMRHFDVQLIGGMTLHQGKIAEMRTGEGKTLVATLPAYLNALPGKGVHVVTVNEYLAQRDADWMGPIYRFLGLTVGVIKSGQNVRREARRVRLPTSPTAPTTNSVSTTCATTWRSGSRTACSAASPTPSSTKWTRS